MSGAEWLVCRGCATLFAFRPPGVPVCPFCGAEDNADVLDEPDGSPIAAGELGSLGELEPRAPWWMRTANRVLARMLGWVQR